MTAKTYKQQFTVLLSDPDTDYTSGRNEKGLPVFGSLLFWDCGYSEGVCMPEGWMGGYWGMYQKELN